MAVYCTLVISERYLPGAIAVAHQLQGLDPGRDIVCLASAALPITVQAELGRHFSAVHVVDAIDAGPSPELSLLQRPELRLATTKIHLWSLPYDYVVYLDADTLPVRGPLDLLFAPLAEGQVAAAPDTGWPDIFNSGVLGLRPSPAIFSRLLDILAHTVSFDGSDQGLLNEALEWVRLPFVYNVTITNAYQYRPAYLRFASDVRILHFVGAVKPWDLPWEYHHGGSGKGSEVGQWWRAYDAAQASPLAGSSAAVHRLPPEAEADARPFDPSKLIEAPPDYWNAATHAPFKGSKPEADLLNWPAVQSLTISDESDGSSGDEAPLRVHVFPQFGVPTARLPFEDDQTPAERMF